MIRSAPLVRLQSKFAHSDFEIQYVTEVVRINANRYKYRSSEHRNQLNRAHFNPLADRPLQTIMAGRLSPTAQLQRTADGWSLPHELFSSHSY